MENVRKQGGKFVWVSVWREWAKWGLNLRGKKKEEDNDSDNDKYERMVKEKRKKCILISYLSNFTSPI